MPFCSQCGMDHKPDDSFCPKCGRNLKATEQQERKIFASCLSGTGKAANLWYLIPSEKRIVKIESKNGFLTFTTAGGKQHEMKRSQFKATYDKSHSSKWIGIVKTTAGQKLKFTNADFRDFDDVALFLDAKESKFGKINKKITVFGSAAIAVIALFAYLAPNETEKIASPHDYYIDQIKNSFFPGHTQKTIEIAVNNSLSGTVWSSEVASDGRHLVNVNGTISYRGQNIPIVLQFVCNSNKTFIVSALDINGAPQNRMAINTFIANICAGEGATE